jgi:type VI secretion system protein ImpA
MAWLRDQQLLPGMGGEAAPAAVQAPPAADVASPQSPAAVEENAPFLEEDKAAETAPPDAFELAMEAATSGRQAEAIEILTRELETERSGRGRFRRRTQLAHLLMAGGKEQVAMPMLEQLAGEIDERKLEQWEAGDALAYPLSLLLKCLRSAGDNPELTRLIYSRICRLDPIQALKHSE